MRSSCFVFILLVIMVSCFGCTQSNSKTNTNSQNKPYTSEEAIKRGDVVQTSISVNNFDRFINFFSNYNDEKADKIRITGYTIEGDPIFTDLNYDGKKILYTEDNSNDAYGAKEIIKDVCNKIIEEKKEQRTIWYSLSSCSKDKSYLLISIDQNDFQYKQE
ncbi:DUF4362 domain-containing protein [Rummeliibacillus sp. NPDC094406]|uniref:DUF4362 domain-containing protein n=1 Tax=Rummeliibacillus sp. NPDC094406 TaxID=3364511 RepID=UPI0037F2C493